MKCNNKFRMLPLVALFLLLPGFAGAYNILAVDMGGYWNRLDWQLNRPGDVVVNEGYGTPGLLGERWYTLVDHTALASIDFMRYDVLLVQSGFTDDFVTQEATVALSALLNRSSDVRNFVSSGGGLVSWSQPFPDGASNLWDWAPLHIQSRGIFHEQTVEILNPGHPVMANSTDASLSNWDTSWHGYFESWDDRLSVLAQTGVSPDWPDAAHQALTLAGTYNSRQRCGRMVFSMQDADYHSYQGKDGARTLVLDALDWAVCPIPEPSTVLLLIGGAAVFGMGTVLRRRRR